MKPRTERFQRHFCNTECIHSERWLQRSWRANSALFHTRQPQLQCFQKHEAVCCLWKQQTDRHCVWENEAQFSSDCWPRYKSAYTGFVIPCGTCSLCVDTPQNYWNICTVKSLNKNQLCEFKLKQNTDSFIINHSVELCFRNTSLYKIRYSSSITLCEEWFSRNTDRMTTHAVFVICWAEREDEKCFSLFDWLNWLE